MDINSKIRLENNMFVILILQNNELYYELEYDEEVYIGEPYDEFNVYKYNQSGKHKINGNFYDKIIHNSIERNQPLNNGNYLFKFNHTKLYIEFIYNKITYKLEDIDIVDANDLR